MDRAAPGRRRGRRGRRARADRRRPRPSRPAPRPRTSSSPSAPTPALALRPRAGRRRRADGHPAGRPRPRAPLRRGALRRRRGAGGRVVVGPGSAARPTTSSACSRSPSSCSAPRRCGAMDRVFEMTLEYLGDRYSFGRPLSSYQALKHRVADDKMWLEACHAIATAAARRGGAPAPPDAGRAGERGQGVDRAARHRAGAGLRAAPRRHRRHLGARPPPVPAAGHGQPGDLRHAGGARRAHRRRGCSERA